MSCKSTNKYKLDMANSLVMLMAFCCICVNLLSSGKYTWTRIWGSILPEVRRKCCIHNE